MALRFRNNWYTSKPHKGSGLRCIRLNNILLDPTILNAAQLSVIVIKVLQKCFHHEMIIWIDPHEVCYRIGEYGRICQIFYNDRKISIKHPPWGHQEWKKTQKEKETCKKDHTITKTLLQLLKQIYYKAKIKKSNTLLQLLQQTYYYFPQQLSTINP